MSALDPLGVPMVGTSLIEASAGTGKTHAITTLLVRLLLERGLTIDQILVVTFTNAATAELRDRTRARLKAARAAYAGRDAHDSEMAFLAQRSQDRMGDQRRLVQALRHFDEASIFTIHGFCQRILQRHAFESCVSFDLQLVAEQRELFEQIVNDFWQRRLHEAPAALIRFLNEERITPTRLVRVVQEASVHRDAVSIPGAAVIDLAPVLERYEQASRRAAQLWEHDQRQVEGLLRHSDALNRTKYSAEGITNWVSALGAALDAATRGSTRLFDRFERVTSTGLREGCNRGKTPPSHRFFLACDEVWQARESAREALQAEVTGLTLALIDFARQELRRRKEARRVVSFDDLLHRLDEALHGPQGSRLAETIRARYGAALIDEFQDTDPVQYRIFRAIYHGGDNPLFLIGDRKQAIYGFRGADIFAYLRAAADAKDRTYPLRVNWRSDPGLVEAINTLFARATVPFVLPDIPFSPTDPAPGALDQLHTPGEVTAPFRLLFVRREGKTATRTRTISAQWCSDWLAIAVVAQIARQLQSGAMLGDRPVHPGDIAVLVRKNAQALAVQRALRDQRIPSAIQSDASVFDSCEALEVEQVLTATEEPTNSALVRAALATSVVGVSGNDLAAMQDDEAAWERWALRFHSWRSDWVQRGFIQGYHRMLDELRVQHRLLEWVDGERRMTNLLHLGELLHQAATRQHLGPDGLLSWLRRMRLDARARGELASHASQIRLESDEQAVKVVTIHKSKGLQYPVVFCPFLWESAVSHEQGSPCLVFHDPENADALTIDFEPRHSDRNLALAKREALAEGLRLLYVAVTRAKHQCNVIWGAFHDCETSALGYLLHQSRRGEGDLATETAKRFAALDDDAMLAELRSLEKQSSGKVQVTELLSEPAPAVRPAPTTDRVLRHRELRRTVETRWHLTSYSSLTSSQHVSVASDDEARDRDQQDRERRWEVVGEQNQPDKGVPGPLVLETFPRGAKAGILLHTILAEIDFAAVDQAPVEQLVGAELARFGLPGEEWRKKLCEAIALIVSTPLRASPDSFALKDIDRASRLNEMEFIFPVGNSKVRDGVSGRQPTAPPESSVSLSRLATLIDREVARGAAGAITPEYADQVRRLGSAPFEGFLRGFVDLVFEHQGKWYVADYKSNYLGEEPEHYRGDALIDEMARRHYFLQYLCYSVAVHRHLGRRVPGYDYDRHFGGVCYLFLRGMSPRHPLGTGVFWDRPPRTLIDAVSLAFEGGEP